MKNNQEKMTQDHKNQQKQLHKFFVDGIKDIYWAEKNMVKALPDMIENASDESLREALSHHLAETKEQVSRVEKVFASIDLKPTAKTCEAMKGLIEEAKDIMDESEEGVMRDAGIIAAAQKVEHYEIATYGTLSAYAEILGYTEAADLLKQTLMEERAADEKLTEVTAQAVVMETSGEEA